MRTGDPKGNRTPASAKAQKYACFLGVLMLSNTLDARKCCQYSCQNERFESPSRSKMKGTYGKLENEEGMAEREGFEPPIPFRVWPLSRRLVSTTHAPLRVAEHDPEVVTPGSPTDCELLRFLRHTAVTKKALQDRRAFLRQYAGSDLHLMVQRRMIEHLHH